MIELLKRAYRRLRLFNRIYIFKDYTPIDRWFWENGDNTYRLQYPLNKNSLVLDLGGYKGEWAEKIYQRYQPDIFIFEPVSGFQHIIAEKFSGNPKVRLFRFGLGDTTRTETIFLNADGSSTHLAGGQYREEVGIVGINQFFEEHTIWSVDLMKINIEGEEYPLLEAMIENGLHLNVKNLQVQFHPWAKEAASRRERIRNVLSESHILTYDFPFVWENWMRTGD